jgi:selenophosphate synthetase-related protein
VEIVQVAVAAVEEVRELLEEVQVTLAVAAVVEEAVTLAVAEEKRWDDKFMS